MTAIRKYPRTPHLTGSRIQPGDEDLTQVAAHVLHGLSLVVEEKLDGSNCGVSFDVSGSLCLQSRGHLLTGGPREKQFDLFKRWANHHTKALRDILGTRYVMYGEWLFACHTIPYDQLPHYFIEFDVLDREEDRFLTTAQRRRLLSGGPIVSAPIIKTGRITHLESLIARSACSSSETMEGLYLKHEDENHVINRYKFVRASFLQAVEDSGDHWMDRPIEPNRLCEGVDLFS